MGDCTGYDSEGDYDHGPCKCPVCKGFLKWVEKAGEEPQVVCNKCHTPLIIIPDDDSTDDWEHGKICALKPLSFQSKKSEVEK